MDRGSVQHVLRCPRCSKPFDKQATLRRHGYYCRSKQAKSSSRPRACRSCAKRKSRCDGNRPSCTRCLVNSLDCWYPGASATQDKGPEVAPTDEAHTAQCDWDTQLAASPPSADHGRVWQRQYSVPKDIVSTPAPGPSTLEAAELPWSTTDADFADYLVPQGYQYNTSPSVDLVDQSGFLAGQPIQSLGGSTSFNLHMPPSMSQNTRSFVHRPKQKTGGMGIAKVILHTLKSYPVMLTLGGTLPPFIHPHVRSWDSKVASIEPLEDCISLMQMANTNISGGRKLFWKVVRMECERLCEEILGLNKRTLLAAMQALFIYIVIRVDEGPTEHNNIDQLLVKTVIVLSQQFNYGTDTGYDDQNLDGKWNKWIFEESVRRVCVVYQVLDLLIYFEPTALCALQQQDIVLAPLPTSKRAWEAPTALLWGEESERTPATETIFGMASDGELVKLNIHNKDALNGCEETMISRTPAKWHEWCSIMDGLGGLVMLAAALQSCG